jgi:hypothetical protein
MECRNHKPVTCVSTKIKPLLFILSFIIFAQCAFAQYGPKNTKIKAGPDNTSFPGSFIGNWKGTLLWYRSGEKQPQKTTMQLRIQPIPDSADQYTWNIIYGDSSNDKRPYKLKPVDTAKGHWVVDELNGILLDEFWTGGKLCNVFTVDNVTIVHTWWLEDGNMVVEFISYPTKPIATTGKGTEDIPFVNSYDIRTYQKAILKKQ